MTRTEFRSALDTLELSQGAMARLLAHLGDTAEPMTIRRRVERWAQGATPVPGEMAALVTVLTKFPGVLRWAEREGWEASGFGTGRPPELPRRKRRAPAARA